VDAVVIGSENCPKPLIGWRAVSLALNDLATWS